MSEKHKYTLGDKKESEVQIRKANSKKVIKVLFLIVKFNVKHKDTSGAWESRLECPKSRFLCFYVASSS